MKLFSELGKIFSGSDSQKKFSSTDARERFVLLGAAGEDGQIPLASFGEGSTVILSNENSREGTIYRYTDLMTKSEEETCGWICVGSKDENGYLSIYTPFYAQYGYSIENEVFPKVREDELFMVEQRLPRNDDFNGDKVVSFSIDGGSFRQRYLEDWRSWEDVKLLREISSEEISPERRTLGFDLIEMGSPVRSGGDRNRQTRQLRDMIPIPVPRRIR